MGYNDFQIRIFLPRPFRITATRASPGAPSFSDYWDDVGWILIVVRWEAKNLWRILGPAWPSGGRTFALLKNSPTHVTKSGGRPPCGVGHCAGFSSFAQFIRGDRPLSLLLRGETDFTAKERRNWPATAQRSRHCKIHHSTDFYFPEPVVLKNRTTEFAIGVEPAPLALTDGSRPPGLECTANNNAVSVLRSAPRATAIIALPPCRKGIRDDRLYRSRLPPGGGRLFFVATSGRLCGCINQ
jgi:hypothetical protein